MRRTRHVLVMTLVATALCADRVTSAAPRVGSPQVQSDPIARLANHLATKLSRTLRRVVAVVRLSPSRREGVAPLIRLESLAAAPLGVHVAQGSPFQFRLPPPACL
jgi:hypothetical protein